MSTRIQYSPDSSLGQMVAEFTDALVTAKQLGDRLTGILDSVSAGGSWTEIEAEVGGMQVGEGQQLYNLVTAAHGLIDVPGFVQIYKIDQG